MLKYFETPFIEIRTKETEAGGVTLIIKREDLNHPSACGNKWWKLKYNLECAKAERHDTLLTFGGAYSNHLYATAAAARELGFRSIGIVRGEKTLPLNSTLAFATDCGMKLHYVSRDDYKKKTEASFVKFLIERFGNFYLIPEGGSNALAVKGCAEFAREKLAAVDFDYLCVPTGTGATLAGIIEGMKGKKKVMGFSVLKNGDFLSDEVRQLGPGNQYTNWSVQTGFHFGGYAKQTPDLTQFILRMKQQHQLPLDLVYTGKMMAGIFDLISQNHFAPGSRVMAVHTGGLRPA